MNMKTIKLAKILKKHHMGTIKRKFPDGYFISEEALREYCYDNIKTIGFSEKELNKVDFRELKGVIERLKTFM